MNFAGIIYVTGMSLLLLFGFIYFVIKGVHANKLRDLAYQLRILRLKKELPPSEIMPALLDNIYFASVYASGASDSKTIAYIRQDHLIFESLTYTNSPDNYQVHTGLDLPCNKFTLQTPVRDSLDRLLYGDAFELYGGIYKSPEGKRKKAGPYLIRQNVLLSKDFYEGMADFNGSINPDMARRQLFIDELIKCGVKIKSN